MSTPAELAEQEAAEREAEELAARNGDVDDEGDAGDAGDAGDEGDDDELDAGEGEGNDTEARVAAAIRARAEQASSLAEAEAINKKLDGVENYLRRKYEEIFGADAADLLECELCTWSRTPGRRPPIVVPEAVREAVKRAIGLGTLEELVPDPRFNACQVCHGHGKVLTGSKVVGKEYADCPTCKGAGFVSSLPESEISQGAGTPSVAQPQVEGGLPQIPDFDQFGTPRGHPDYGKLVQYREVPIGTWADNLPK